MKESVRLGRIAGVAVGFNWSLLLIAAFIAVGLGSGRFPIDAPGYSHLAYAMAGGVTAMAFLAGVLLHEVSHAVVARREGLPVESIVLWFMGGYTRIGADPQSPGAEIRISGAGPLASLVLGLVFMVAAIVGHHLHLVHLGVSMLGWLATINLLLAAFNVLPGSPLDGGRILHAVVWGWTHDRFRATRAAALGGRVVGGLLVAGGLLSVVMGRGAVNGVWLAVVGWFLIMASRAEEDNASLVHGLDGLRAGDVMVQPPVVPGWLTAQAFLEHYGPDSWGGGSGAIGGAVGGPDFGSDFGSGTGSYGSNAPHVLLLQQWGGGVTALVPLSAVQAVPEEFRFTVRAIDVAVPLEGLPVANPNEPADVVMRTMQEREARWILLVDAGHIVGVANQQLFAAAASGRQRREPGQARPVDLGVS